MQQEKKNETNSTHTKPSFFARSAYWGDYKRQKRRVLGIASDNMYLESTDSAMFVLVTLVRLLYSRLAAVGGPRCVKNNCKIEIEGYIGIELHTV